MLAPKPLLATLQHIDTSSPLATQLQFPSTSQALERLRSPIHLTEPSADLQPSLTPSTQRRSKPSPHPARRRRPTRECRVTPRSHAFDDLPWIASLESSPDLINPWDIADLSLLPVPVSELPASGPGPVRRRKTSLRSSPLASSKTIPPLPIRDTSLLLSPSLSTPRSHFTPSRVLFQNLMPVACDLLERPSSVQLQQIAAQLNLLLDAFFDIRSFRHIQHQHAQCNQESMMTFTRLKLTLHHDHSHVLHRSSIKFPISSTQNTLL
ncbi:hypothetical protein BYT27DRAFT_7336901 [Phlegmacium glaucopus]|nr:hypothetical protein BYT27DRAFT_7336901 [Phlegmacium glaucopus]